MSISNLTISRKLADPISSAAECRDRVGANPAFGAVFTQHMVTGDYDSVNGWRDFQVVPLADFSMHPGSAVLHYGQSIFEGLKAYAQPDGAVAAFRPEMNAQRFDASARRLAMPPLPPGMFIEALRELVDVERNWVPSHYGESLYLRPLMFARDAHLATRPSSTYTFVLMACPVGPYFPNGVAPVSVWVSHDYVRAVRGGTGEAKFAGNYAASFLAQQEAAQNGCDQVVWLDAIEFQAIEEMGGMNLYFVVEEQGTKKLVTPAATGSLLKGVTRASLLQVAADLGYQVEERRVTVQEWEAGSRSGSIPEAFACGTAAVVTPIGRVKSRQGEFEIGNAGSGPVTMEIRQRLLDIQHGRVPDTHLWLHRLVAPPSLPEGRGAVVPP